MALDQAGVADGRRQPHKPRRLCAVFLAEDAPQAICHKRQEQKRRILAHSAAGVDIHHAVGGQCIEAGGRQRGGVVAQHAAHAPPGQHCSGQRNSKYIELVRRLHRHAEQPQRSREIQEQVAVEHPGGVPVAGQPERLDAHRQLAGGDAPGQPFDAVEMEQKVMPGNDVGGEQRQAGQHRDAAQRQRRGPARAPARQRHPPPADQQQRIDGRKGGQAAQQAVPAIGLAGLQHDAFKLDAAAAGRDAQRGFALVGRHKGLERDGAAALRQRDVPGFDVRLVEGDVHIRPAAVVGDRDVVHAAGQHHPVGGDDIAGQAFLDREAGGVLAHLVAFQHRLHAVGQHRDHRAARGDAAVLHKTGRQEDNLQRQHQQNRQPPRAGRPKAAQVGSLFHRVVQLLCFKRGQVRRRPAGSRPAR